MLNGKSACQISDVMRPLIKEQYSERIPEVLESIYTINIYRGRCYLVSFSKSCTGSVTPVLECGYHSDGTHSSTC